MQRAKEKASRSTSSKSYDGLLVKIVRVFAVFTYCRLVWSPTRCSPETQGRKVGLKKLESFVYLVVQTPW